MWPRLGDLLFLCQGPLHIFLTPVGHVGSCNSSTLSTTRSHGSSLFDNHVRKRVNVSSILALFGVKIFLRARISATDLCILSSLSPLIQNTPPGNRLLLIHANSTASDVLPQPPSPHIVFVQQEVSAPL